MSGPEVIQSLLHLCPINPTEEQLKAVFTICAANSLSKSQRALLGAKIIRRSKEVNLARR